MFSDWLAYFWPQLLNPWRVYPHLFNLPWFWIVLQPLRLLGPYVSGALVQVSLLVALIRLSRRLRLPFWRVVILCLSAPVFWHVFMGQIDGLILLAYVLPPAAATFLTLAKPQTALGAGVAALRSRPLLVLAVGGILVVSAFLIWHWPLIDTSLPDPAPSGRSWNYTLWPWTLLLVPLLFRGLRARLAASPFVFPYAGLQSLVGPMIVAATLPWPVFLAVWALLWWRLFWMLGIL
jgi:hypothetical protein